MRYILRLFRWLDRRLNDSTRRRAPGLFRMEQGHWEWREYGDAEWWGPSQHDFGRAIDLPAEEVDRDA